MPEIEVQFKTANTEKEFVEAQRLFRQYAQSLNVDLSFQDFEKELKSINEQYNKPKGALLLAFIDGTAIGCSGIRELDTGTAELKRMYVQPEYRKYKIGFRLLELSLEIAQTLHYKKIRLDTLPTMTLAQALYHSFGFYQIPPYRFNPIEGTIFMEKKLE